MSVAQHIKDKHDAEVKARNARPLLSVSEALRNLCQAVTSQREEDIDNSLHDGRRALGGADVSVRAINASSDELFDKYIREGDYQGLPAGEALDAPKSLRDRLVSELKRQNKIGFTDTPQGKINELYAMPAATCALLDDGEFDPQDFLFKECLDVMSAQLEGKKDVYFGDMKVLRDPYSAKPHVLFYTTLSFYAFPQLKDTPQ